jgi:hypothetical protein
MGLITTPIVLDTPASFLASRLENSQLPPSCVHYHHRQGWSLFFMSHVNESMSQ